MESISDKVLDCLREQFASLHKRLDEVDQWRADATKRLLAIGRSIAAVRRDAVLDAEHATNLRESVDALTERVAQIEKRLDIVG